MKNYRAIILLLFANAISGVAQGISMIAIPWYFTSIIDETQLFGIVYFLVTAVSLLWGPYAGILIDRFNRRKIMLFVTASGVLIIGSLAVAGTIIQPVPWLVVALAFGTTVFIFNIHYPNLYAFVQEIVEVKNYGRITSFLEIQGQTTLALAGALGAILLTGTQNGTLNLFGIELNTGWNIKAWTLNKIFILDACTYGVSFILLTLIRYEPLFQRTLSKSSIKGRFLEGIEFLKSNPLIFIFGNASYIVFASILVASFFLIPKYIDVQLHENAGVYAAGEMFFALGSLVAGFMINKVFQAKGPVRGIIILSAIASVIYFFLVFNIWAMLFYIAYLILGLANAGIRILRMTYIFKTVPNDVIGRIGSIFMILNTTFRMFFIILFSIGYFTRDNNVIYALLILGIFTSMGMLVLLYYLKPLRKLTHS